MFIRLKRVGGGREALFLNALVNTLVEQKVLPFVDRQLAVVISHSCDVTNSSYEKEPYCELLLAVPCERDGLRTLGKSPRAYQLAVEGEFWEFKAWDRVLISRSLLSDVDPEGELSKQQLAELTSWLVRRYKRIALPDAFNIRLGANLQVVKKLVKLHGTDIFGIYAYVDPDKELLDENETYRLFFYLVVPVDRYRNDSKRAELEGLVPKLEGAFARCNGIEIIQGASQCKATTDVSLEDLLDFARLDLDHLSFEQGDIEHIEYP